MANQPIDLQALGSEVARAYRDNHQAQSYAVERARQKFLECSVLQHPRGKSHSPRLLRAWLVAVTSAAAIAATLLIYVWSGNPSPLTFRVDGKNGSVESWLAAPAQNSVFVEFSDGTGIRLDPSSGARIVDVKSSGARVSLESGALHAEVVHTSRSAWSFVAGPIHVRVIGTKFDMRWDPTTERFAVSVSEGTVGVSGAVAGAERPVRAGDTLFVSVRDRTLKLVSAAEAGPSASAEAPSRPAPPREAVESTATAVSPTVEVAAPKAANQWRDLAKKGQLREAFALVEAAGFAEACQTANPAELLLLGDAARLAGRPERATLALMTLRQRYPSDGRRAAAAFALGKVAFDQRRAFDVAANWFSTCEQEQPTGAIAREAAGRLIEAYRAAGNRTAAQSAAQRYLTRYPSGPHAELARSLLP